MIPITIRKPVWHDRSISINQNLVSTASRENETFEVRIKAKPYTKNIYHIKPSRILNLGKYWTVKGTMLINFPIDCMELVEPSLPGTEEKESHRCGSDYPFTGNLSGWL